MSINNFYNVSILKKYFLYKNYYGLKEIIKDILDLTFYLFLRPFGWLGEWRWRLYQKKHEIKEILIIFWGAVGDVISSSTVIWAVRQAYPYAEISFLGSSFIYQIFPGQKVINKFIDYDRTRKTRIIGLIRMLRHTRYDLAINLKWSSDRSALMTILCNAKFKLGSGPRHWQFFYNLKARPAYTIIHQVERFQNLIYACGIKSGLFKPVVIISPDSKMRINLFWKKNGLDKKKVILLHPGAKEECKKWDIKNYSRIIQYIDQYFPFTVLIAWGPNEYHLAAYLKKQNKTNKVIIGPKTNNINELAALIQKSKLFIGNNSAPMNVAVAVDTPSVIIMGSQNPVVWSPYGNIHSYLLPDVRCKECKTPCTKNYMCQRSILVKDVFKVIREKLT